MEIEVKQRNQRNRRRERAQRMHAQRENKARDGDSGEDESPAREKPPRPPIRRKKSKEPILEEDIIDGFAIMAFRTYEDLENAIKLANKHSVKRLSSLTALTALVDLSPQAQPAQPQVDLKPKVVDTGQRPPPQPPLNPHHIGHLTSQPTHVFPLSFDAGTSDDSGRASERLTTSSLAPRDPDSSRDRLSDTSSRCSSGKGYICDSEGDDDKGSDGGSVVFSASTPATPRKPDFSHTGLPLAMGPVVGLGGSASPSAPPAPSPAPAALPPSLLPPYSATMPVQVSNGQLTPIANHNASIKPSIPKITAAPVNPTNKSNHKSPNSTHAPHTPHVTHLPHAMSVHKPHVPTPASNMMPMTTSSHVTQQAALPTSVTTMSMPPMNGMMNGQPPHTTHPLYQQHPLHHPLHQSHHSPVKMSASVGIVASLPPPNHLPSRIGSPAPQQAPQQAAAPTPPASLPVAVQQPPAAAPAAPPPPTHPPGLESAAATTARTNSPAVATSAVSAAAPTPNGSNSVNSYPPIYPSYQSLYAPYAATMHSPYLPPVVPTPAASPRTMDSRINRSSPMVVSKPSVPSVPSIPTSISTPMNVPSSQCPVSLTNTMPLAVTPVSVAASAVPSAYKEVPLTTIPSSIVARGNSPRGHSPTRERDSYSSNVSSLSRSSATPVSAAYSGIGPPGPSPSLPYSSAGPVSSPLSIPATTVAMPMSSSHAFSKTSAWPTTSTSSQLSPASLPLPRPSSHSFPTPMFATPMPPPAVSTASPHPFSAESLFQSNQADMLRRELDNRFLASQDRGLGVAPPPYLRTEMHHHQHQHTHVHQHQPLLPPPVPSAPTSMFPPPLFKDIPKLGTVDSPFYRSGLGVGSYPGYTPGLLHPGLSGPTPFVPPSHLPSFAPKQSAADSSKPKQVKSGKWNAMHVRIAWEIYHHQQKQSSDSKSGVPGAGAKSDMLRPPSHLFPGGLLRPHELPPSGGLLRPHELPPSGFPQGPPLASGLFNSPASHLGGGMSPFGRYGAAFTNPNSPFASLSPFPSARDLQSIGGSLGPLHDPWRSGMHRSVPSFPPAPPGGPSPWSLKPDPAVIERREQEEREREMREREQRERERARREREERDRQREREREREEKQRKQQLEQQERERERERERREKERREMERREMERERLLQQQRMAESNKLAATVRDRSPMRNGTMEGDIRVKEEQQRKEDDIMMLGRTDARYHPHHSPYLSSRHPSMGPPHPGALGGPHGLLDRSRSMLPPSMGGPLPPHFAPPGAPWPTGDPFRDPYRFDPLQQLRFNPLMEAAFRAEQEAKMYSAYAAHTAHMRSKEPSPVPPPHHLRGPPQPVPPHKMPPVSHPHLSLPPHPSHQSHPTHVPHMAPDNIKKEESSQAR